MDAQTTTVRIKHELRTPINHIVGYSELMMEECEGATEQQIAILQELSSSGQRLARLVEQVVAGAHAQAVPAGPHGEFLAVLDKIRGDLETLALTYAGKSEMRDLERIHSAVAQLAIALHGISQSA